MRKSRRKRSDSNANTRRRRRCPAGDFYAPADPGEASVPATPLDPADPRADIARLQLHLRRALSRRPGDTRLLLRTSEVWLRAALAAHRVSPTSTNDIAERAAAVYTAIQKQLLPDDTERTAT